jgi:DNA-directed RNA polymerase alpha subunit
MLSDQDAETRAKLHALLDTHVRKIQWAPEGSKLQKVIVDNLEADVKENRESRYEGPVVPTLGRLVLYSENEVVAIHSIGRGKKLKYIKDKLAELGLRLNMVLGELDRWRPIEQRIAAEEAQPEG